MENTDEFSCYRLPEQFVQWYEIEPTVGWILAPKNAVINNSIQPDKKKIRSTSAYALFFREKQNGEKRAAPYATFGQISQRIARQWEGLTEEEKKEYKKKCEKNRKKCIANAVEEKAKQLLMGTRIQ